MYKRHIIKELKKLAKGYPVVTVTGPRQAGKTTLVQAAFPKLPYVNLEALDVRAYAQGDPRGFLADYPDGAVLDEIQYVPDLLSYIQVIVDEVKKNGMFIMTGSHQLQLHAAVSQSLAGRTALLHLLPMSLSELAEAGIELSLDEAILTGGYPRIFKEKLDPTGAYRNYLSTYVERDVRQLINLKDLVQFQRFLRLCAGRIGQVLNIQGLSNDVGISAKTVQHWLSILEASFVVVRLQPYFEKLGKRVIKSPKLYFTDVGFASYLLGLSDTGQLKRDPLRGNLVENLVMLELMKARLNRGLDPQLYYYRDARGNEVDLIFQSGRQLIPIEVKAASTFNRDFLKGLRFFKDLAGERCPRGFVVFTGDLEQRADSFQVLNYTHAARALDSKGRRE